MNKLTSKEIFVLRQGVLELTRKEERRAWEDGRQVNKDYIDQLFQIIDKLDILDQQQPSTPFSGLLSAADAADQWTMDASSIRRAIADGRLTVGIDCQKYGKQWVITTQAMTRVFGTKEGQA